MENNLRSHFYMFFTNSNETSYNKASVTTASSDGQKKTTLAPALKLSAYSVVKTQTNASKLAFLPTFTLRK